MPALRTYRSSRRSTSFYKRRKDAGSLNITSAQRNFLRKLVTVLGEIIDEDNRISSGYGALATTVEDEECSPTDADLKASESTESRLAIYEPKNAVRLVKLCKDYEQLSSRVRSLLDALGGGGQTAKVLGKMGEAIEGIKNSFEVDDAMTMLKPRSCVESLEATSDAAFEAWIAFKDLGVFNTHFSDAIAEMITQLKATSAKLDAEYGQHSTCLVDHYLDQMFEPLLPVFETFLDGLASISEKEEIAAIRQMQDFQSQRYLNLTTVATFLSSVTATTLQMTADNSGSPLSLLMNTIWFISLVFSTASAVYSLLVMTWRQSSVCQPDLSLPTFLYVWFRDGPMYALMAALISFSIGLCLLSFQFADQGEIWISGVISTSFAVINSCVILLFVTYYFLELQKREADSAWGNTGRHYFVSLAKSCGQSVDKIKDYFFEADERLKKSWFIIGKHVHRWLSPILHSLRGRGCIEDNESNPTGSVGPVIPTPVYNAPEGLRVIGQPSELFDQADEKCSAPEAAMLGHSLAVSGGETTAARSGLMLNAEERSEHQSVHNPPENLLQFSRDGKLLAHSQGCTITIYDVNNFSVLTTLTTPGADEVKEISWYPGANYTGAPMEKLLVYSRRSTSIWDIRVDSGEKRMVLGLRGTMSAVHWGLGVEGFSCVTNTTARLFNTTFETLQSIDISKLCEIDQVIDAIFVRNRILLCLVDVTVLPGPKESHLLAINLNDGSIQRIQVGSAHKSMTLSLDSEKILLREGNEGNELVELSISRYDEDLSVDIERVKPLGFRIDGGHQISLKEAAVAFYGHKDNILIGYLGGEVAVLYYEPGDDYLSALHIFTTPTTEAMPQRPVSFAVNGGSMPYMFAFSDEHGNVTIWSVQSNTSLDECRSARKFVVHDRRGGSQRDPLITTGRFLTLPLPTTSSIEGR